MEVEVVCGECERVMKLKDLLEVALDTVELLYECEHCGKTSVIIRFIKHG